MSDTQIFSAESMTEGQPDKMCDLIADTIVDQALTEDRFARVAIDAFAAPGLVMLSGQLSTKCYLDLTAMVRQTVEKVGYTGTVSRFNADSIAVLSVVEEQSPDVALVVDKRGAGNQCIVTGYATNEGQKAGIDTNYMPMPIWLAHQLSRKLTEVRKGELSAMLKPDGHTQVTVVYEENVPVRLYAATVSNMHYRKAEEAAVKQAVKEKVIHPVIDQYPALHDDRMALRVNPGGPFTLGGPQADTGITGRKPVGDCYGTACAHGGSALCGKDPTKTDRSATYMARYIAKNLVAAEMADRIQVRIAYLFGVEEPLSIQVQSFRTGKHSDKEIANAVREIFDVTSPGIIDTLNLQKVKFAPTACYGAMGRADLDLPWERTDKVSDIKSALG